MGKWTGLYHDVVNTLWWPICEYLKTIHLRFFKFEEDGMNHTARWSHCFWFPAFREAGPTVGWAPLPPHNTGPTEQASLFYWTLYAWYTLQFDLNLICRCQNVLWQLSIYVFLDVLIRFKLSFIQFLNLILNWNL